MQTIIEILDFKLKEAPSNYGLFHIFFILLVIGLIVFLCAKYKNSSDKTYRKIVMIAWIVMLVLEIYKQFNYTFSFDTELNKVVADYQWYAFPYQFCSTPLYIFPLIAFLKDGKVRNSCISFASFFIFFGGLVVYFYPNDVLVRTLGISIQTMIHHGLQIVIGVFTTVYFRKDLNIKYYLRSLPTYVVMIAIAIILNETIGVYVNSIGETFNMFFISRHFKCTLPILSSIYTSVPYIVFLLTYFIGFSLAAYIMYLIFTLFIKKIKYKKN